jgi:hypothetical protein
MTTSEVRTLVEDQIGERSDDVNPHGISLRESLVPPQRMKFTHWFFRDGAVAYTNIDAWLVLEERPKTPDGYKIIYDEQTGKCGLALRGWYNGIRTSAWTDSMAIFGVLSTLCSFSILRAW